MTTVMNVQRTTFLYSFHYILSPFSSVQCRYPVL